MFFYAWSLRPHYTVWPDKFILTMRVTVNVYLCSKGLGSEELRSVTWVLHAHMTDPNKIPEHQSSGEQLPWLAIFHTHYTSLMRNLSMFLCDSIEKKHLEACTWFFMDFAPCVFSICWFYSISFHCKQNQN